MQEDVKQDQVILAVFAVIAFIYLVCYVICVCGVYAR